MTTFDRTLIIATNALLCICYPLAVIAILAWSGPLLYQWCCLSGITFFLGLWKDYRNADAYVAQRGHTWSL